MLKARKYQLFCRGFCSLQGKNLLTAFRAAYILYKKTQKTGGLQDWESLEAELYVELHIMDQRGMVDWEGLKGFCEVSYSWDRGPVLGNWAEKGMGKCNKI